MVTGLRAAQTRRDRGETRVTWRNILPSSVLWRMLASGLRVGVLSLGLGVTAAPGPGLCWMHTCTALAALLHRAPCHVRRQQQGYTLFLASYTRSLSIKCGAVLVKLPPGWASGWVPARQTDRCWRARSTTKCGRVSATLATRAWRV